MGGCVRWVGVHLYWLQVIRYTLVLLQLLEDFGKQPILVKVHYALLVAYCVHVILVYSFHVCKDHSCVMCVCVGYMLGMCVCVLGICWVCVCVCMCLQREEI